MCNNTGCQASQDVVFDKNPIVTPLFPIFTKSTSLSPLIRPTYFRHSGPICRTSSADHLGDGRGWVGKINPHTHTRSCFYHRHFFRLCRRGIRSCGPDCRCGNDCICHRLPTGRPVRDLCVCPLVIPPGLYWVRVTKPDTASVPLPFVSAHLISFAEVTYEADIIQSDLSS